MVERHGVDGDLAWAIAGRNAEKLQTVADETGADVPHIVLDADDTDALAEMCASTKLVISTVGPYALYGEPLVAACVEAGTERYIVEQDTCQRDPFESLAISFHNLKAMGLS